MSKPVLRPVIDLNASFLRFAVKQLRTPAARPVKLPVLWARNVTHVEPVTITIRPTATPTALPSQLTAASVTR